MTSRDRQIPDASAACPPARPIPARLPAWEMIYRALTPSQRAELLKLAGRQGLLYAHQLPAVDGPAPDASRLPDRLKQALRGWPEPAGPPSRDYAEPFDSGLSRAQREAVSRALGSPDLFLVAGLPGTGKVRVAAEIVRRAVARGERVLVSAPSTALLDRALAPLAECPELDGLRLLAPGESADALPAPVRAWTEAARERQATVAIPAAARRRVEECAALERSLRERRSAYGRLGEAGAALDECAARLEQIAAVRESLAAVVEHEVGDAAGSSFQRALADLEQRQRLVLAEIEQASNRASARLAEQGRRQEVALGELRVLRPLADARRSGRIWSAAFWKALGRPGLAGMIAELEDQCARASADARCAESDLALLDAKKAAALQSHSEERAGLIHSELTRRQTELEAESHRLQGEREALLGSWNEAVAALDPADRPETASAVAARAALQAWQARLQRAQADRELADAWSACLSNGAELPARLRGSARVVAGCPSALAETGAGSTALQGFDLLVLLAAEGIAEDDVLRLTTLARRCVLVGETLCADPPADTDPPDGTLFGRLWRAARGQPALPGYSWVSESDRLRCRLREAPPGAIQTEPVADSPEVQLGIWTPPASDPVLAEVVFPPEFGMARAKAFIERELGELALEPFSGPASWAEDRERIVLSWASAGGASERDRFCLAEGVSEVLAQARPTNGHAEATPALTARIEFARAAGWCRAKAEAWVRRRLRFAPGDRTALLSEPDATEASLASFILHLLGSADVPATAGAHTLEFVAVPEPAWRAAGRPAAPAGTGGAGLEIDLGDFRQRSKLPPDLRQSLPQRGLVNLAEARAIVTALETAGSGETAVIALDQTQAELIRALSVNSGLLRRDVQVLTPPETCGRSFATVFVSLTRSHLHRAVSFGESPAALARALTRARTRLVVFGDPGTLARRARWEGPLEHLDPESAAAERLLVVRLLACVQGRPAPGAPPRRQGVRA